MSSQSPLDPADPTEEDQRVLALFDKLLEEDMERERYSDSSLLSGSLFPLLGHGYFGDSSDSDFSRSSIDEWSDDGSLGGDGDDDEDDEDYDHNDPDEIFEFWNMYGDSDDWNIGSSSGDGEEGGGSDEEDHDETVRRVMQALEEVEAGSEEAWRELERAALRADKEDEERRREMRGAEGRDGEREGERRGGVDGDRSSDGTEQNGNSRKRVRGESVEVENPGRSSGDKEAQDEQRTQDDSGLIEATGDIQNIDADGRQWKRVTPRSNCGRTSKRRADNNSSPKGTAEPIAGTGYDSEVKEACPGNSNGLVTGSGELGGACSVNVSEPRGASVFGSKLGGACSVNGSELEGACSVNGNKLGGACSVKEEACSVNSNAPYGEDSCDDDASYPKAKSKRQRLVELNSGNVDFSHYRLEDFLKSTAASHSNTGQE